MNLICYKNRWVVPLVTVGAFLVLAFLFISLAQAAEEAQVQAAVEDLSSATGQNITSEDQARDLCNQEQYLDVCADIGKKHDLYTEDEIKHVDDFLSEIKGQVLADIKACQDEDCLIKVASQLAQKVQISNPTLATDLKLTTTIVAEKKAVVDAAKEVGINFGDCEAMNPDTAPVDLLRKCAKLAKDSRVQKYIPENRRVLAQQFEDSATFKLRESLVAGKYQCGDGTLEGCGNYCLNPGAGMTEIPAVCKQIATEVFGSEGVKELESAYQHVGRTREFYSKKFILVLPDGKELVGEGQIRNTCDQAFSKRNFEIAKACGNFAVKNGFANQAEVDKGLKLMESFSQKGQSVDFEKCINDPRACRDIIPDEDRGRFDAGNQIFEIMKTEIGFDPSQCERGSVDQTIGTKCFEGSKRALAKIESLNLTSQSQEARFIIEDIKRHVNQGEEFMSKKDEFRQVFSQQGGPGGCKSEAECFTYCSNPANGPECISFGAKQGISGFKGDEAVQRFQEYNYNIQKPGLTSDEYRQFPSGGPYPQYPGQGPYPGFQPPGQGGYVPPGQVPGFTQPGPGFNNPPPGAVPYYPLYPGPGPVGPSPECFAAIQSGDFVRAKTVCSSSGSSIPFPTGQICPASPYVECPVGQYHESYRNSDGCWVDGPCKPAPTYSSGPYPTYTYSPPPPPPGGYQCSDGIDNDNDGKIDYPADHSCYGPDDFDEYYPSGGVSPYPTYTPAPSCPSGQGWDYTLNKCSTGSCGPGYYWDSATVTCKINDSTTSYTPVPSCPSGQWWEYTRNMCVSITTSYTPPPSCPSGQWWDYAQNKCSSSTTSPYPTGPYPTYTSGTSCSQSLTNLLGTGCHWMYSDSSGRGIYCNSEMSKSAKEGDTATTAGCYGGSGTYSPYPSPSYTPPGGGSCPAGYHSHGESGGFCMNDQENYGGTCYDSVGTNKITCPQPTYSPYPTYSPGPGTSSCSQSLINLLGAGCHWMYSDSSGRGIYCDGPMSKSAKEGDTATTAGCSGGSGTYTPYPTSTGYTYTPLPSCPSDQYWNGSSCINKAGTSYTPYPTSTGYTYTPLPSCPSDQYWNGSSCINKAGTSYTPYPTTEYVPPPTYSSPPPTYSSPPPSTYSPPPAESYSPPPPPPTSSLYPHYIVTHCQQLGRTWNGKVCEASGLFARFFEDSGMANVLRLFYIIP